MSSEGEQRAGEDELAVNIALNFMESNAIAG